jgi:hypothetical protein
MLYQAALAGWHDFFILAGTASATLRGTACIIVAGILLLASSSAAFGVLVTTIAVLLLVSLRKTRDLLVTVADVTQ